MGFALPLEDAFDCRLRRVRLRADIGDVGGALEELRHVAAEAPLHRKIEGLCESAILWAEEGKLQNAKSGIASAEALFAAGAASFATPERQLARACLDLAAAVLSSRAGRPLEARNILSTAITTLDHLEVAVGGRLREVHARMLLECGDIPGSFHETFKCYSRAITILRECPYASPLLCIDAELKLCQERNRILADYGIWSNSSERLAALAVRCISSAAQASGSLTLTLLAARCYIDYHSFAQDDAVVLEAAHHMLAHKRTSPVQALLQQMRWLESRTHCYVLAIGCSA